MANMGFRVHRGGSFGGQIVAIENPRPAAAGAQLCPPSLTFGNQNVQNNEREPRRQLLTKTRVQIYLTDR